MNIKLVAAKRLMLSAERRFSAPKERENSSPGRQPRVTRPPFFISHPSSFEDGPLGRPSSNEEENLIGRWTPLNPGLAPGATDIAPLRGCRSKLDIHIAENLGSEFPPLFTMLGNPPESAGFPIPTAPMAGNILSSQDDPPKVIFHDCERGKIVAEASCTGFYDLKSGSLQTAVFAVRGLFR